ncbi:MotA/TolQ/ExbB proton channel family protein [Psychrosphaera sp. B3R10]|uniref:MotA/TolQ/ExbB proton channel family protein n=1 Tax=unclassified Psychrosphaera TaxID=2641570 RepID=UPI001C085C2D|nr:MULTISPECIES: MotA/TolQ/ExbB proton channel family protein [unclassified Psychrosphaera]MBU2883772.1 MotA/TolQ/ExbB proton channel family protein [Psychrosphaera sp. I2R16]MBU2987926.1 MotA/TolQ/ExbB proton channel family protein [Psychrosphaera sp. B3R10]
MIKFIKPALTAIIATGFACSVFAADEAKPLNLDELLQRLEQGQLAQSQENKSREQRFLSQKTEQVKLLNESTTRRNNAIKTSEKLETQFENNEFKLADLSEALNKRMGSLKELFGVLQQVSGDTAGKFKLSNVSAQYPGRDVFFEELAQSMGGSSNLASIAEIEQVWFELQREMTEQGKVARFTTDVVEANGNKVNKEVLRIGSFSLVADGKYLDLNPTTGTVAELIRQPSGRFLDNAQELQTSTNDVVPFALDPTGGSILGLLVQAPNTQERVEQGGTVGYIIIVVGIIAFLIAFERFVALTIIGQKVIRQLKSKELSDNNPLGRVLKVNQQFPNVAYETLELKLSEAMLREMPKITRNLTLIKIVSVVAPLLGLLGTVTGMIKTFQAITLFGAGDPKLMAGGISTALMTTVLGLVVAIPTVVLSSMLNTRSKNILFTIQEQSAGIIAERAEEQLGRRQEIKKANASQVA